MPTREAQSIRAALQQEQRFNAQRTHLVRFVAVTFFFGLFLLLAVVQGDRTWSTDFSALGAYWCGAALVVALSRWKEGVATWLTLAPVFLDMPFIYVVQRATLPTTPVPGAVAGFSLGLFVMLLILAMLSLARWQVALAATVGAAFEVALQREANVSVGGQVSAVAVMAVAGFLVAYSGSRLRELLVASSRQVKLAALGQLSAAVGHDLRNPLAATATALFSLRRRLEKAGAPLDDKAAEALALAEREIRASQRIVSDLLDYARESTLALEPTPLKPLVDEAVSLVRRRPEVQVSVDVASDLSAELERDRFRQVLVNLVQNACEAVPEGRAGHVEVRAVKANDRIALSVRDDGSGIDEVTRARLFEPLFTTKKDGTGLGLAIVESLVKQHGGTLTLESVVGQGTTFTIEVASGRSPLPRSA
ncbi:MAG: HAMP domain-containing sensor histidine kinase [Myxococcaceae bacterium]|nr:HAMP domain-containing sensor histidine kinase [Myxococcaceae bacterium]